jgi:hypothetical protein
MLKKVAFSPLMLTLLILVFAASAFGQTTASIQGTVSDQSGAAVVGAKVTVKNTALGIERTTQTSSTGSYEVPALPPGTYSVQVQIAGFETQLAKDLLLQVSQNSVQNFGLKVASTSEIVTVEATAPVVEATTMTVGQTIDQRTVQEIPLNGRHFVDLALLIPGTVTPPQNGFLTAPLRGQGSFAINTAGNREDAVNFMINGINLNDMVQNQVTFQPTINTVSEFKVDNSTYSAEYGRNSGAIVNIATRSGTEQFHGEVYDYLRNDLFDARNAFNPVADNAGNPLRQSPFKRNQFGGDIGGPIKKGKTYFFLSYEGLRHRQGLTTTSTVWTDAQRNDILAGGSPIAASLLGLVPHANSGNKFVGSATAPVNIDQGTADIRHVFNDRDTLHGYYVYQNDFRQEPTQGANIPGFGDIRAGHRQVLTLNETHVFSSALVNEARLGANRILITFTPFNTLDPSTLGLSGLLGPNQQFLPTISFGDIGLTFGDERQFPQGRGDTTFVAADTLSYVRGKHSFKFGTEFRDFRNDNFNNDPGQLVFNCSLNLAVATQTCPGASPAARNTFAQGIVSTAARTLNNVANRINQGALDFFGQDSFKLTSALTFELGLRFAWNMTPTEAKDRFTALVPVAGAGSVIVPISEPYGQNHHFQPRVGFAWDVFHTGNTILRGGYAYQVDQPITGVVTGLNANPLLALPISVGAKTALTNLGASFDPKNAANISPLVVNPDFQNADVQSWNLNIQQQVGRKTGFMVGYFGSKGTHLEIDRNINQFATLGTASSRPFQAISTASPILNSTATHIVTLANSITERDSNSNSSYSALWVTANQHVSHGLQFNASYTWSHSIDEASRNNNGIVVQDSTNILSSRANSDFDARHRFVVNGIYDLPFQGNRLVSGWELAPILSFQSGNPFNVVINSTTVTGSGGLRPNLNATPIITGNALIGWFGSPAQAAQFFVAPGNAFGNVGRNSFVGPGFSDVDLALIKNTKLSERMNLQLRADAFDLLNHPNYGQPNGTVGPNLGIITSTRFPTGDSGSSRQLQLAMKLKF